MTTLESLTSHDKTVYWGDNSLTYNSVSMASGGKFSHEQHLLEDTKQLNVE